MIAYSKFNDPKFYRNITEELMEMPLIPKHILSANSKEEVYPVSYGRNKRRTKEQLEKMIDQTDREIIETVAIGKFVMPSQIYMYLRMRGNTLTRDKLDRRLVILVQKRLLYLREIKVPQEKVSIRFYMVSYMGQVLAMDKGVYFHRGNWYIGYDAPVSAVEAKRYIMGNQIIQNLLLNRAQMTRFAVAETFRIDREYAETGDCMFRPAVAVWIDNNSVLAFEVASDIPERYIKLADKVSRYYQCADREDYFLMNYHGDLAYPQLVICGENFEHNKKIVKFLRDNNLWREDHTLLFTENHLHVNGTLTSIYALDEDYNQQWFSIPKNISDNKVSA